MTTTLSRAQVLDLYFLEARCRLIEVAAFLDRVDRATGDGDFRLAAFRGALKRVSDGGPGLAEAALVAFSDPTQEPVPKAPGKGAVGAWAGPD